MGSFSFVNLDINLMTSFDLLDSGLPLIPPVGTDFANLMQLESIVVLHAIIPSKLFSTAFETICSKFLKFSSGEIFNKQGGDFNEWSFDHFSR